MEILEIELKELLLIKFYMIQHLIFLIIHYAMGMKEDLLQWFTNCVTKNRKKVGADTDIKNESTNQQLADKLHN